MDIIEVKIFNVLMSLSKCIILYSSNIKHGEVNALLENKISKRNRSKKIWILSNKTKENQVIDCNKEARIKIHLLLLLI